MGNAGCDAELNKCVDGATAAEKTSGTVLLGSFLNWQSSIAIEILKCDLYFIYFKFFSVMF